MKTVFAILRYYAIRKAWKESNPSNPDDEFLSRYHRRFRDTLFARIEAGDRAREALDELANNWYSLDSDEGKSIVEDMES